MLHRSMIQKMIDERTVESVLKRSFPQTGAKDPEPETGAPPHPVLNKYFIHYLIGCRNPCSLSKVMVQWLCLLKDSLLQLILSCPHNRRKGVTNEPFSKIITNHMTLPIPYCLDAKIQISNSDRQNCQSCRVLYSGIF
jgi:hypothetical protein